MAQTVRVLILTDGPYGGFGPTKDFHLGEFVRILTNTTWDGFAVQITRAHRSVPSDGVADLTNFKLTDASLSGFDILFLFAILGESTPYEASPAEVAAIARFMDNGGGVFATGDHENLGAGLCRSIPRVRSMRRWYWPDPGPNGEPVAPIGTPYPTDHPLWPALKDRYDTLRPGADSITQFDDQSDRWGQPIAPTWYEAGLKRYPHPLLCSPAGVVTKLPDHPHEGRCEVPADLAQVVSIGGYQGDEYPMVNGTRVAPEVVAVGTVLGGHWTYNPTKPPTVARSFALIAAWDGHRSGCGRVVVDSTWHHFFNVNLTGDPMSPDPVKRLGFAAGPQPNPDYEQIKAYYRNLVYWLIPKDRYILWFDAIVSHVRESAFFNQELPLLSRVGPLDLRWVLHLAHIAEHYFATARGACWRWNLPDLPILVKMLPKWKLLRDSTDPYRRHDVDRPLHPSLSVSTDVLSDVLFGTTFAVIARWAQDNPADDLSTPHLERLQHEIAEELSRAEVELVKHTDALANQLDELRNLLRR